MATEEKSNPKNDPSDLISDGIPSVKGMPTMLCTVDFEDLHVQQQELKRRNEEVMPRERGKSCFGLKSENLA